jgi:hypothetical protein
MLNGQIVPAMTGLEALFAAVVALLVAAVIGRLARLLRHAANLDGSR